jgi:sortase B
MWRLARVLASLYIRKDNLTMRRKKNKRYKKVILNIIIYMILLFVLIYSGIKIFKWYNDKTNNNKIAEQIKSTVIVEDKNEDENKEEYTVDFKKLKEQNNETVAWIKVNNTNVEYPVLRATNNSFYLNHSFDKSKNSAGWIFADYRNKFDGTDKNIIIYGHNMRDDSMFGSLKNILNSAWYDNEENTNITLYTENEKSIYKVFSIYKIESEDYYIKTEFSNDNEFEKFIETLKKRSIKNFNIDISKEDSILTLSTCANNNKYRVVLHAKKM